MSKASLIIILILIAANIATLYYFMVYDQRTDEQETLLDISDVTGENQEQYIGETVTVRGYMVITGAYTILVTHPQYFWSDQLNSSNHLLVSGVSVSSMSSVAGIWISVTGTLQYEDLGKPHLEIAYQTHTVLQSEAFAYPGCYDSIISTDSLPDDLPSEDINPTKYAVLFSGGIREWYAYSRYWNHITWFYVYLLLNGYDPDNIFILYNDGVGDEANIQVDYPGTSDGMNAVFTYLSNEMGRADSLFMYVTDHGGEAGINTWEALDPDGLNHTEVTGWLDSITCHHMIVIMQQCFAGAFIPFLSAPNRIIMTACSATEYAWAANGLAFSEFTLHLLTALWGFHPSGNPVNVWADINNDGMISVAELFGYAAAMDSKEETPLYDDNGDQLGSMVNNIIGTDGDFGLNIFI
ncbi:MAG: C13 family peptidase [Candidatus Thorarchaeota archaeon]